MKDFLKMTLASMLGVLVVSIVLTIFGFAMLGALASLGETEPVMPRSAALKLDMSSLILTDQTKESDPMSLIQGSQAVNLGVWDAVRAINAAAADPAVKYIYMKTDGTSAEGMAQVEELRCALENFRLSGKPIVTYMEAPSNAGYYLASVSDRIYMTEYEGGMSLLTGLSTQVVFVKDILDKLGVNVQLIRHGKYKSAGEMFIKNNISPENREQNQALVNSIWSNWSSQIAASREITPEEFNGMIDKLQLNSPQDWLENGLVDELVSQEELRGKLCDMSVVEKYEDVKMISLQDYAKLKVVPNFKAKQKIAVVYASGDIVDGSDKSNVDGDRFAAILADIRRDSTVKAVVFRVNSPGGSVLASEKIKNEVDLLRQNKPVIASYGNYAASGGYWISNSCDKIYANAGTLTGSIGVFSMIPDFSGTMKDIAHVNIVSISTNKHGDMYSGMRALDSDELAYMQASVESIYEKFTSTVAEGRSLEVDYVDSIAQGRVWSGSDASEIGLVDAIGTLEDAIQFAAMAASKDEASDLSAWQIVEYPKPQTTMEALMEALTGSSAKVFAGTPLEDVEKAFRGWNTNDSGKVYARMPYEIAIK